MKSCVIGALAAFAACAGIAHATTYVFDRTGAGNNSSGGTLSSIHSTFNAATNRLTWSATFSNRITDGFTLVISPDANPKGHPGELAILYFDSRDMAAPKLTVYSYNAQNDFSSYVDGTGNPGIQAPDRILTSVGTSSFVNTLSAADVSGGKRTLSFDIDASVINNHVPLYVNPNGNDWTGSEYGNSATAPNKIGIWFHYFKDLSASYDSNGYLTSWNGTHGWLDLAHGNVTPAPGSVALMAIGGLIATRRKR